MPLVREVIQALNSVGVPNKNVIVYDRNSNQLEVNGYHTLVPSGVRVVGLDQRWNVKGETRSGYDPNVFVEMDCFGERETRSYLASIVTTEANKVINLPCLKEHNASGVTGCLKNLAYGSFNNVARTHVDPKTYTDPVIPVMCTRRARCARRPCSTSWTAFGPSIRAGRSPGTPSSMWEAKTLLFGTDPVAVDRIELEIVEQKRKEVGVPSLVGSGSQVSRDERRHAEDRVQEPVLPGAGAHQDRVGARAREVGPEGHRAAQGSR